MREQIFRRLSDGCWHSIADLAGPLPFVAVEQQIAALRGLGYAIEEREALMREYRLAAAERPAA